ncbi:hypothetical protein CDAR_266711 [Caerostris darwini]|uniref:Uncharacterized protein n=1 Tax=Caerostris darwini TaxID=1538125 RepID=A0AAV4QNF3_9ARAC|nr:hypothetical protein CDAR_266711 [Caerostris darwini]
MRHCYLIECVRSSASRDSFATLLSSPISFLKLELFTSSAWQVRFLFLGFRSISRFASHQRNVSVRYEPQVNEQGTENTAFISASYMDLFPHIMQLYGGWF